MAISTTITTSAVCDLQTCYCKFFLQMKSRQKVIQYESKLVFTNKHGFKSRPTKSLFSRHILLEFLVIRIWSYLRSCIEEIIVDILRLLANCFYHLNLIFPLLCFENCPFKTSCDHFPLRTIATIFPCVRAALDLK